jgi:hypothetical protein
VRFPGLAQKFDASGAKVVQTTLPGHLPKLVSYLKPPVEQALKQGGSLEAAIRQNIVTNVEKLKAAGPVIAPLVAGPSFRDSPGRQFRR